MTTYLKKEERKAQIKKAAIELFTKHGYTKTSVQDIVDRAEFSKGGFYNCYSSKEELFKEIMNNSMEQRYDKIISFKNEYGDLDKNTLVIETLLDKILDINDYKKLFIALIMETFTDKVFFDFYKETIDKLMENFDEFCDKEEFSEYKILIGDEFNVLITSLILGVELFNQNNNDKYRDLLRELFTLYIEKKFIDDKSTDKISEN